VRAEGITSFEHRSGNLLQHRVNVGEFAHARLESGLGCYAKLEPEATQDAADLQLHVEELGLQLLASGQEGVDLLRRLGFAMHRSLPAHAHHPADATERPVSPSPSGDQAGTGN
jgi:hypothetical protein